MSRQTPVNPITPSTHFGQSIDSLVQKMDRVPTGWQRAYCEMIVRLRRTISPSRSDLILLVRPMTLHGVNICLSDDDEVIEGIIRKTNKAMACTCSICGKKGRRVRVGTVRDTLCATCLAPRQLQQEVKRLLRRLDPTRGTPDQKKVFTLDELAPCVRLAIPEMSWTNLHCDRSNVQVRCVARQDLEQLRPRFDAIQAFLSDLLEPS